MAADSSAATSARPARPLDRRCRAEAGVELVVARYREDLRWTGNVAGGIRVTIYDKGGGLAHPAPAGARVEPLPNLGFEAHSYLHHLVERYDRLAPLTVFVQGRPFDHEAHLHRRLAAFATGVEAVADFRWLGFIIDSDDPRGRRLFVPWSKNPGRRELEIDRFHRLLFGEPCPGILRFFPGAQFAVSAACVRRQPREFYRRALDLAAGFPDAGHCFERLWDRVFGVRGVDPAWLGDAPVRYLKPIRRLGADRPDGPPGFPATGAAPGLAR